MYNSYCYFIILNWLQCSLPFFYDHPNPVPEFHPKICWRTFHNSLIMKCMWTLHCLSSHNLVILSSLLPGRVIGLLPRSPRAPIFLSVLRWTFSGSFCCSTWEGQRGWRVASVFTLKIVSFFILNTSKNISFSMVLKRCFACYVKQYVFALIFLEVLCVCMWGVFSYSYSYPYHFLPHDVSWKPLGLLSFSCSV